VRAERGGDNEEAIDVSRRVRIVIEQVLALATAALAVLTIFWPDWIERIFGWDPDESSGAFEVALVVGLFVVSVAFFVVSRIEGRRTTSPTAAS
jgi:hypothetical protein